ncbi:MAG: DUF4167 domain-containing protein [Pseudomonadota bacterium]
MRQGNNQRRGRGRSGRRSNVPLRAQTFESTGPEGRVRGNPTQVYEKYSQLARDTQMAGDRVLAESFQQHAEHYYRILNESMDPGQQRTQPRQNTNDDADYGDGESDQGDTRDSQDNGGGRNGNRRGNGRSRSERAANAAQEDGGSDSSGDDGQAGSGQSDEAPVSDSPARPRRKPAARSRSNSSDNADEANQTTGDNAQADSQDPANEKTGSEKSGRSSAGTGARRGRPRKKPEASADSGNAETVKSDSGNDEDAGLLKILGESPREENKDKQDTDNSGQGGTSRPNGPSHAAGGRARARSPVGIPVS